MYKNMTIYYFSGTGNALTAARWIEKEAKAKKIATQLIPVDRLKTGELPSAKGKTLIGFCYPTHGFNLPWIMLKFIIRFPLMKGCNVFLLNTRAGSKIGSRFLPGISGIAQVLPLLILLLKGFRIRGMFPLDMPSNWISVHPGFNEKTVSAIFQRCQTMIKGFCEIILEGKISIKPAVYIMLPLDLALAPVALMYLLYGRFYFAKIFIASTDCNTCRLCETHCPTGSIKIIDRRPFWKLTCESCMRCINICPRKSIEVSHSLAVLIPVISSFVPAAFILTIINDHIPATLRGTVNFLVNWGMTLSLYFLVSGAVFWLIRSRVINRLFSVTSLTRYWRRYMAKGIGSKNFSRFHS